MHGRTTAAFPMCKHYCDLAPNLSASTNGQSNISVVGARGVVRAQRVQSKIVVEVAPDGVDVVCVILRIVVLDDERRALNPVVVWLPRRAASGPGKVNLPQARLAKFGQLHFGQFRPQS